MKWVCLLLFGSVGATAFLAGVVWGGKRWALLREGVKTTGKVVDLDRSSRSYYPEVEFTAQDGKTYRFRGSTGSNAPSYETGAPVPLVYDPKDPHNAQVTDFEQFWLGPLGIGLFGFLFLVAGIGGFFLIADSDRTFGPEFEARMDKARLVVGKEGIPLQAEVMETRQLPRRDGKERWVVVVKGGAPGGARREFTSTELGFDPGHGIVGKTVTVYADPQDPDKYVVDLEPLFKKGAP